MLAIVAAVLPFLAIAGVAAWGLTVWVFPVGKRRSPAAFVAALLIYLVTMLLVAAGVSSLVDRRNQSLADQVDTSITAGILDHVVAAPIPQPPQPTRVVPSTTPGKPLRVIVRVGDSLTAGDGSPLSTYGYELDRVLTLGGQPHQIATEAIGGTKCNYWATHLAQIFAHNPSVILLDCGTNDTWTDNTLADYNAILDAAAAHGVPVVAALIDIPDMRTPTNLVRPDLDEMLHAVTAQIQASVAAHPGVLLVDHRVIPATLEWKTGDGVHRLERANVAVARMWYERLAAMWGLPSLDALHIGQVCGLSGSWRDDPEPVPGVDFTPCTRS